MLNGDLSISQTQHLPSLPIITWFYTSLHKRNAAMLSYEMVFYVSLTSDSAATTLIIPYSTGIKYLGPRLYVYFIVKTRQTCAHCDVAFWTVLFLDRIYLETIEDGRTKLDMTQHIKL